MSSKKCLRVNCKELSFPLYVLTKSEESFEEAIKPLDNGVYYFIAKDGMFTVCKNAMYTTIIPTKSISGNVDELKQSVLIDVPKIDKGTFDFIVRLFQSVYKKFASEVNVLLYYSMSAKAWYVRLPKQDVSGASVSYELTDDDVWYLNGEQVKTTPEDVVCFGTCHSHASMGAFFSGTDDKDDASNVGYQIVIGKLNSTAIETKCRLTVGSSKIDKKLEEVVEDIPNTFQELEVPDIVTKSVTTQTYAYGGAYDYDGCSTGSTYASTGSKTTQSKVAKSAADKVIIKSSPLDVTFLMEDGSKITTQCVLNTIKAEEK